MQEIRRPGKETVIIKKRMILYSGHKNDELEFGKGFYISRCSMDNVLHFERIKEGKKCKIRVEHEY